MTNGTGQREIGISGSVDAAGNEAASSNLTFTTRAATGGGNLVSHWPLDDGSGAIATDVVASYQGTLRNGAAWTSGRHGMAVSLDGDDDHVELPAIDVAGSALTISAWVNSRSFPSNNDQRYVSKAADMQEQSHYWMLGQASAGNQNRLRFRVRAGGTTTTLVAGSEELPLNIWYHAAATYDGATMRLYLDGVLVGSMAKSGVMAASSLVPVFIGANPDGSNFMRGIIGDVRIYSRALSASEVASLSGGGAAPANAAPTVSLTTPANGSTYTAPADVTLSATASDTDGTIARVDFYAGSILLGSDTSSPYAFQWNGVAVGTYSLTAVARDDAGAITVSSERVVTVSAASMPNTAVFVPSSNHDTAVDRYVIDIYPAGADPSAANPVATRDVGKPAVVEGEVTVDIGTTITGLPSGSYIATVTAWGPGGRPAAPRPRCSRADRRAGGSTEPAAGPY